MTSDKAITTDTLLKRLFHTSSFERFKARYSHELCSPDLCSRLDALCRARGETHEAVIRRAGIDRVYDHQIFCGRKRPSRDKVIQLAFGFGMGAEDAQELLRCAGQSKLYPRIERDAAILYCLHNNKTVTEAQTLLSENGLAILGGDIRHE